MSRAPHQEHGYGGCNTERDAQRQRIPGRLRDEAAGELGKVLLECGAETIEPAQLKQLIRASLTIGIGDALKRLSPA